MSRYALIPLTYVLGFVLTFGHAYHTPGIAQMQAREATMQTPPGARSIGAFMAAVWWPLYWSTHIWEPSK